MKCAHAKQRFASKTQNDLRFSGIPLQRRLQLTHVVRQLRAIARLRPPLADVETKL
jgi:hypothetical protein